MKSIMLTVILFITWVSASLFTINHENRYCGDNINILELTIKRLHEYYRDDTLTPRKLVKCYLKRTRLMNQKLGNIIEISNEVKNDAKQLSSNLSWINKPLYGVPIIISGSIMTNDSMPTSLGDVAISESEKRDAIIVNLLRDAGAIFLGKAIGNVEQFPNPYNLRYNLTGCSAGSAISSNLAMLAVSVEPDVFSLTSASELSLTAIKLTRDDVSMSDILVRRPFESSIVALARNVVDCLTLFKILSSEYQKEPKKSTKILETSTYLNKVTINKTTRVVGFAKEDLFDDLHRTQVPHLREFKEILLDTGMQISDDLVLSLGSKECLLYYYAYYKLSLNGSQGEIKRFFASLPCTTDDLKLELLGLIEENFNSSKIDALVLPYLFVAFLPQIPVMVIPSSYQENGLPYGIALCTKKSWIPMLFNIAYLSEVRSRTFRLRPKFLS